MTANEYLVLVAIASPIFAAGGAWFAVRTELTYLRRDLDGLSRRVESLDLRLDEHQSIIDRRGLADSRS